MASPAFCTCGRRRSQWSALCSPCSRAYVARLREQRTQELRLVNMALDHGLPLVYSSGRPSGRLVRCLYDNGEAGGVWSIDDRGEHWCEGAIPRQWVQASATYEAVAVPA